MATTRKFAYNTGSIITGATQYGSLAIGVTLSSFSDNPGGVKWWNGPDEDLGYVIAHTVPSGNQPNPKGLSCSVGFWRTNGLNDQSFLTLVKQTVGQTFATASTAATWLNTNGYWTSWIGTLGSLLFNGSSQYLTLSPGITFGAGAYTVEGWFYNNSGFANKGILGSPVTSPTGCLNLHFINNTSVQSDKNGGGGAFTFTMASAISTNAWHYFIYNRNSNGVAAVYIDGVRSTTTSTDTLNYNTATDTIGRDYAGYWPGYWTNMRITVGSAVYDSSQTTQSTPTSSLTSLANTKYLMLGASVTPDTSGTQTVTNVGGVTQSSSVKPF
jgi:hypothetical protein